VLFSNVVRQLEILNFSLKFQIHSTHAIQYEYITAASLLADVRYGSL